MVSLSDVKSSNSLISTTFPPGLVAVFVGATSGIGEITLKKFAQYSRKSRAYFIGRSQEAADRILEECKVINPEGEYIFIKADVSLIKVVDKVCKDIRSKENCLNILFLSAGTPTLDRSVTSENLHLLTAAAYYSRIRFTTNLLPLLKQAPVLRRIVSVGGGGYEGPLDPNDFPALRVSLPRLRGHLITLTTLCFEAVARTAPEVSFIHNFPGTVKTQLFSRLGGIHGLLLNLYIWLLGRWICVPIDEAGERHLYLATSARFPPLTGENSGVRLGHDVGIAMGTIGRPGSGMYSVLWNGESAPRSVLQLLAGLRNIGMEEAVWRHTEGEFNRITGSEAGS